MIGPAKLPDGLERRAAIELRATGRRLEGMAAVFNTPARIGGFEERIMPGAFRGSLAPGADVLALVDHDPGRLLARTSSGSAAGRDGHRFGLRELRFPGGGRSLAGARQTRAARRVVGRGVGGSQLASLSEYVRGGPIASRWRLGRAGPVPHLDTL